MENIAENDKLYYERASGKPHNPNNIITKILEKHDIVSDDIIVKKVLNKRIKRFEACLNHVDEKIINTLEYLSRKGIRMCLISNADVIDKIGWGLIIFLAMIINLLIAGLFGFLIPLGLKLIGVDPALASAIFLTTATDVFGFFAFLGLAKLFLNFLR